MSFKENKIETVIFDLGGVLIDWDPRHCYRKIFKDEDEMEFFLKEVCNNNWNIQQDAGRSFIEASEDLKKEWPKYEKEIDAYRLRWEEMLNGAIEGTVEILKELKAKKTPLYALTNWSSETFPIALEKFDFLKLFDGIVVSGDEKMAKPDSRFYKVLFDRYSVVPENTVFIDDNQNNIKAAESLKLNAIHFKDSESLRQKLEEMSVL